MHETPTPQPYEVAFENEYVRIVTVQLEVGQKPPPYHPVAVPLVRVDLLTGAAHYDEEPVRNVSTEKVREIQIELKGAPEAEPSNLDAVALDPERYRIDFENDRVRIVRLHFEAHERGLLVAHPPRVLVTLSDVWVKVIFADGRTDEHDAPAGLAVWLPAETLQTENTADQLLEVVLIEPRL
jgi:hypothetical protein